MDEPVIELFSLTKSYGKRRGIAGVDLKVPRGCLFGFLGPNGAGKSTSIRLLLGLLKPDRGHARIFGRDCWTSGPEIRRDVGYLPGDLRLDRWMTAHDALRIYGHVRGRDLGPKGNELAGYFSLDPSVKVRRMSRGMRQKLGLILALAHEPGVLILDEPTSGLDPLTQEKLYDHLRLRAKAGCTVFFSSHILHEVEQLCDRVAIMKEGHLRTEMETAAFREKSRRIVTLRWREPRDPGTADLPSFLTVVRHDGDAWECAIQGDLPPVLKWLAEQDLQDVTIGKPDFERLFREYYEGAGP